MGGYFPSFRVGFEVGNKLLFAIEGSVDGDAMLSTRIEGASIESFDDDSFAGRKASKEAPETSSRRFFQLLPHSLYGDVALLFISGVVSESTRPKVVFELES